MGRLALCGDPLRLKIEAKEVLRSLLCDGAFDFTGHEAIKDRRKLRSRVVSCGRTSATPQLVAGELSRNGLTLGNVELLPLWRGLLRC